MHKDTRAALAQSQLSLLTQVCRPTPCRATGTVSMSSSAGNQGPGGVVGSPLSFQAPSHLPFVFPSSPALKTSLRRHQTCCISSASSRSLGCPRYGRICSGAPESLWVSPWMGLDTAEGPSGAVSSTGLAPSLPCWQFLNPLQGCNNSLSLQSPPNFLRASALAEHVKPVVVIPEEAPEDEEPENLIEISTTSTTEPQVGAWGWDGGQAVVSWLSSALSVLPRSPRICLSKPSGHPTAFGMTGMGVTIPAGVRGCCHGGPTCLCVHRDAQIESLKKELETLRAEMEKIKLEVKPDWGAAGVEEWDGNAEGMQQEWGPGIQCCVLGALPVPERDSYWDGGV